ncbi:MAG TPA: response regulator transcription factor [Acidimicrobiales bacterium]|jgi:two-component system OmpR family response regulator
MRVLVAEDDPGLRSVLERGLRRSGYVVDAVPDGDRALLFLRSYDYEVAVLDWRMPGASGLDVVQEVRRRGSKVPVLLLTARDTTEDRVEGLDGGADDYLVKPFEFAELLARIRALQRRPPVVLDPLLAVGDLALDPATRLARRGDEPLPLTGRELAILELLLRRHPAVVDRRSIAVQVWDDEADAVGSNTIDVHLARLRAKLTGSTVRIETVRGIGYKLVDG